MDGTSRGVSADVRTQRSAVTPGTAPVWPWVGPALVLGGAAAWIVSLLLTDPATKSDYGLLAIVNPLFFVGLALVVAGFTIEVFRGLRPVVLVLAIVCLVLMIDGTVPILYHNPEYTWTFKHLGVIQFFRTGQGVADPRDIYQQWPALFTSVASLTDVTGVSPITLARWAPLFFSLVQCVPMFAIFRQLTSNRRVPYLAVFVFQSCIWVGTDYLSPQALAFQLSLGLLLIIVTWLRAAPRSWQRGPAFVRRTQNWLVRGHELVPPVATGARVGAVAAFSVVFFAVTAAHQLTPYLLLAAVGLGVVFGVIRPRYVLAISIVLAAAYLLPRFNVVNNSYGLLDSLRFWDNAHGAVTTSKGVPAQVFNSRVSTVLTAAVWLATALVVLRSRRQMGRVLLPAIFAVAPFFILLGQSYGGEAIYRVFLFSLPWCAYLISSAVVRTRWRQAVVVPLTAVVLLITSLSSIQGLHGTLTYATVSNNEVAGADYFYAHAPKKSILVLGSTNWPGRLAGNYDDFGIPAVGGDLDILDAGGFTGKRLGADSIKPLDAFMDSLGKSTYLAISTTMIEYAHYYGLSPDGSMHALDQALRTASGWKVFYRNADIVIYKYK